MHDERLQKVQIAGQKLAAHIRQSKNAQKIAFGALEANQGHVLPPEVAHQPLAESMKPVRHDLHLGVNGRVLGKSGVELAQVVTLRLYAEKANRLYFAALC